jgi:DNA polymerase III subunit epsilon
MGLREVVFDTETTGFDPMSGDRLVEIGCVELMDGVPTGRTYHQLVNPERDIPAGAMAVHGITNEQVASAPLFGAIVEAFLEFIADDPLVAHNADFDFKFIDWELKLIDRPPLARTRMVDTLAIAKKLYPGGRNSLDALATRLGVDTSARVKHGALIDSFILADVYLEMRGGKQRGFDLAASNAPAPDSPQAPAATLHRPHRAPRAYAASPAEQEAHAAFVAKIKESIWAEYAPTE